MAKTHDDDEILQMIKPEKLDEMATQIENFIEYVDKFIFIEGLTDKQYKKIMKSAEKAIKRLRKRKDLHKVISIEKLETCCREDPSFANEYLMYD